MTVRVFDNKRTRGALARLPQVQAAVDELTLEIAVRAEALFASHDHPGGHRIEVEKGKVDGYVSLIGPAAVSVEFGHFAGGEFGDDRVYVKGLHILSRAARL
jgi:hypothetical protein